MLPHGNLLGCKALLCLKAGKPPVTFRLPSRSLASRCVPKRVLGDEMMVGYAHPTCNYAKAPTFHLTLTTDPWQLITAHGSLPRPFVGDDVVVPGELGLGGQGHLHSVLLGQAFEQPGRVFECGVVNGH